MGEYLLHHLHEFGFTEKLVEHGPDDGIILSGIHMVTNVIRITDTVNLSLLTTAGLTLTIHLTLSEIGADIVIGGPTGTVELVELFLRQPTVGGSFRDRLFGLKCFHGG